MNVCNGHLCFFLILLPLFQLIIGGLGKIDLADWKTNTRLKHCTSESNVVRWFWQAVEAFSEERRGRLLQFVTGSTRVPLQGFKALQGGSWTGSKITQTLTVHTTATLILAFSLPAISLKIRHLMESLLPLCTSLQILCVSAVSEKVREH